MTYFLKFPIIEYNGVQCRDLTRRAAISNTTLRIPTAFYPIEIKNEMRPDTISFDYYDDANLDWVVYLSNGIIDPYYGWYLTDDDFGAYINAKYGSLAEAQQKVEYWQVSWADDDLMITADYYDRNLPETLKKYWVPKYGVGTRIIGYQRRQEDWTTSTNRIERLTLSTQTGTFQEGERVVFSTGGVNTGSGQVVDTTVANTVDVQHLQGSWVNTSILGATSNATAHTSTNLVLTESLSPSEIVYWEPVYAYDREVELNESRKIVNLLQKDYYPSLDEQLRRDLAA